MSQLNVHDPLQVSSWKEIDVVLADPTRRMRIISGIAIPEIQVDDDDTPNRDECIVHTGAILPDFIQATCQVGLASITNDESSYTFAIDDAWVDVDPANGEVLLHASLVAKGDGSSLSRFGFQIVVLYGNRVTGVYGRIYWSSAVLDATPHIFTKAGVPFHPINVPTLVEVHAKLRGPTTPGQQGDIISGTAETDIGFVTPTGSIHHDGGDFWVAYAFDHLPLGVSIRLAAEKESPRFGGPLDFVTILGPNPVFLTPSHLSERVDFRIQRHGGVN
jgi:hypothetical protein